jgi:DNA replicative helicase MCM subunit Mcm2 (Cdc46/Mcm family)
MFNCPSCGYETETLHEGYCQDCCENRQLELDLHNSKYDNWQKMSDNERDQAIASAR